MSSLSNNEGVKLSENHFNDMLREVLNTNIEVKGIEHIMEEYNKLNKTQRMKLSNKFKIEDQPSDRNSIR